MRMPKHLRAGETVAITAASGPVNGQKLAAGVKILENMGLRVVVMESCFLTHEYFAGTDARRLHDLHCAFGDKKIRAVFCARGGYGAGRLLPHLDYHMIKQNPKIFAGYSDATALHIVLNQFCELITFHAPMPAADLCNADEATLETFKKNVFGQPPDFPPGKIISHGRARGILTGGNLTLIAASLGTPYEIETRGRILFLEETQEPPYRVDRLLLQLKHAGKLKHAAGFLLGDFSPETAETIKPAVSELLIPEGKPIIAGLPCGHTMPNITLPLGQSIQISTESLHPIQILSHF
ncbi:MAG: LD-carboxypeptidase [Clostridiales bacterium]|nr:LD-carboxypeptidase [Clostridiales bacterium]